MKSTVREPGSKSRSTEGCEMPGIWEDIASFIAVCKSCPVGQKNNSKGSLEPWNPGFNWDILLNI